MRFMDLRRYLATTYRTCRELAQYVAVYTFQRQTPSAVAWRQEVAYRTILLLSVTVDALLWCSTERERWEDEYYRCSKQHDDDGIFRGVSGGPLKVHDEADDNDTVETTDMSGWDVSAHVLRFRNLTHGRRTMIDENFRAPESFMYILRQAIMYHPEALGYKMGFNEYRDLLNLVGIFNVRCAIPHASVPLRAILFRRFTIPHWLLRNNSKLVEHAD